MQGNSAANPVQRVACQIGSLGLAPCFRAGERHGSVEKERKGSSVKFITQVGSLGYLADDVEVNAKPFPTIVGSRERSIASTLASIKTLANRREEMPDHHFIAPLPPNSMLGTPGPYGGLQKNNHFSNFNMELGVQEGLQSYLLTLMWHFFSGLGIPKAGYFLGEAWHWGMERKMAN